ncbi:VCBS repeat-containing protein [Streptomyces sp. NPDC126503]|uniref:FG-GAP repeat domain-containing protein n=1 Tax=Streptomyces sp. NPDC126503 TaxID=3155315 RepID=UPI0033333362
MTALTRHGDFTGDGREDLVARDGAGRLWLYPGRGNGTFAARKSVGTGWHVMENLIAVGSYDGDGLNDLLASTNELYQGGFPGRLLGYRGSGTAPAVLRPVQELNGGQWWKQNGVF